MDTSFPIFPSEITNNTVVNNPVHLFWQMFTELYVYLKDKFLVVKGSKHAFLVLVDITKPSSRKFIST